MPSAGSAVFERRHQERFLLYGAERSDLQDGLIAQSTYIRDEDTAIYSQSLAEDFINLVGIMMNGKTALTYHDGRIVVSISSLDDFLHIRRKDGVLAHQCILHKAAGTIGCDVTIDEMLYLTEVIDDLLGASRRNIHLYPILLSLFQSIHSTLRNPVGLETHQRAVDVEKQCFYLLIHKYILFLII